MKLLIPIICALNLHGLEGTLEWGANSETNVAGYRVRLDIRQGLRLR